MISNRPESGLAIQGPPVPGGPQLLVGAQRTLGALRLLCLLHQGPGPLGSHPGMADAQTSSSQEGRRDGGHVQLTPPLIWVLTDPEEEGSGS